MIFAIVVDDIMATEVERTAEKLLSGFCKQFELGKLVSRPVIFKCFCIKISQDDDMTIDTHPRDKFESLFEYYVLRNRRKQQ